MRKCKDEVQQQMRTFATNIHKQVGLIGDVERDARLERLKSSSSVHNSAPTTKSKPPCPSKEKTPEVIGLFHRFIIGVY